MRIQVMSDLHVDLILDDQRIKLFKNLKMQSAEVDALIIAGDFAEASWPMYEKYMLAVCTLYKRVVYVPGNHEYWHQTPKEAKENMHNVSRNARNLDILGRGGSISIGLQHFIGATMWFADTSAARIGSKSWSDVTQIESSIPWIWNEIRDDQKFLQKNIRPDSIVITHHLPLFNSIDARDLNRDGSLGLNAYYLNDQSRLINKVQPKLWIHGHTHHHLDYIAGNTRIVCNPMGYQQHNQNTGYVPMFIDV